MTWVVSMINHTHGTFHVKYSESFEKAMKNMFSLILFTFYLSPEALCTKSFIVRPKLVIKSPENWVFRVNFVNRWNEVAIFKQSGVSLQRGMPRTVVKAPNKRKAVKKIDRQLNWSFELSFVSQDTKSVHCVLRWRNQWSRALLPSCELLNDVCITRFIHSRESISRVNAFSLLRTDKR